MWCNPLRTSSTNLAKLLKLEYKDNICLSICSDWVKFLITDISACSVIGDLRNWFYFKISKTFSTTGVFQCLMSRTLFIVQGHRHQYQKGIQTLCMQMFGKVFSTAMSIRFFNLYWDYTTTCVLSKSRNLVRWRNTFDFLFLRGQFRISLNTHVVISGVPRGGLGGSTPPPRNSKFLTKLRRIPSSVENKSVTTLDIPKFWQSRTGLQIERNPWLGGYRPQISVLSALCPQLNLLNPPPKKYPGVSHWYGKYPKHVEWSCNKIKILYATGTVSTRNK
jgi:hypothetical protein